MLDRIGEIKQRTREETKMKMDLESKIGRRAFLVRVVEAGSGTVLAPAVFSVVGLGLSGCGGGNSSGGSGGGAPGVTFTVDSASGHTHDFFIPQATLDTPPGAGFSAATSFSGHVHTVTLSQADLVNIAASMAVNGTTTFDSGHDHNYTFF